MSKPTLEQIVRAYEQWDWTDKEFMDAVVSQWWASAEDFRPLDEDWKFIKGTADEASTDDSTWDSQPITKKELGSDSNYEILKNICERYDDARARKANLLEEYNWWKWYPKDSEKRKEFDKKLEEVNSELKSIEDWNELKELFSSIKEVWLWDKWDKWFTSEMWQTLYQIKNKVGTSDNDVPFKIFGSPVSLDKFKWYTSLEQAIDKFDSDKSSKSDSDKKFDWTIKEDTISPAWRLKRMSDSIKNPSEEQVEQKPEKESNWENPKWEQPKWKSSPFWPTKQTAPDIKTATDKMVFWEDVAAAWGNDYLENRNNQLATALKLKWIESREDIDAFLNQYDSWKNAKDERKKNTLDKLTEKVGKIKTGKDKKDEKKSENKDDIFREDNLIKDKNGNTVWVKHIDIKKKEVWDDWTPSNDDSINGIEEDNIIRDKNWRMIWVKHLDIKKKKTAEESNEDIFNEDNLIKDKNGRTVWVKHIDIKKKS